MTGRDHKWGEHFVSFMFARCRTAMIATAAALSVGALITAGGASRDNIVPISAGHSVGLYNGPSTADGIADGLPSVPGGGDIGARCWTVGQSIGSDGDTWYRTNEVDYDNGFGWVVLDKDVYVFAGYADGNARSGNRDPDIPRC